MLQIIEKKSSTYIEKKTLKTDISHKLLFILMIVLCIERALATF